MAFLIVKLRKHVKKIRNTDRYPLFSKAIYDYI